MENRNNKIGDPTILQQQPYMHKHGFQAIHAFLFSLLLTCLCILCVQPSVYAATPIPAVTITQDLTLGPNIALDNPYGIAPDTTYIITGDVTVRYASAYSSTATLTIEPGVELRFETGTGLYIGYYESYYGASRHYYGALVAQGTEAQPIVLTAASGEAGGWNGVSFRAQANGPLSRLEQCVIEYGGQTTGANVYLEYASPTIQDNTIRHSSSAGIHVNGASSSQGTISGNTITENETGILLSSANAMITGNTITLNSGAGIQGSYANTSIAQITANTITGNTGAAIELLEPNSVKNVGAGNTGGGNGENSIQIQGGDVTEDGTWTAQSAGDFPYVITGDVTVRYASAYSSTATLTIEPGVELRFETGTGLYIGYYESYYGASRHYYGALAAQGTEAQPIVLTAASGEAGGWNGVSFRAQTNGPLSRLEQCVIEYGGQTTGANVYLNNALPTIQYNTIRHSSSAGIYVNGTGCNGVLIRYNDFSQNPYGVYTTGSALPVINYNNIVGNTSYGVYNASSVTVDATHNWWGDANGPSLKGETTSNGDWVSAYVNYAPWQGGEVINSLPLTPNTPSPADGAVNVDLDAGTVTLSWEGGDPDAWDSGEVEYDVYLGTAEDALEKMDTTEPDVTQFVTESLAEGRTYFWQIVARDTAGATTTGPIWHFTTRGAPPDLLIASLTPDSGIAFEADQAVTLTATIQNAAGAGPVVDAFQVEFFVDETSLGSLSVEPILYPEDALTLTQTWTASVVGSHAIKVVADSAESVSEDNEANNSSSVTLEVLDVLPPELVSLVPAAGTFVSQLEQIEIALADQHSEVDDDAVLASIEVRDSSGQPVAGTVSESNDTFTFTPVASPFANDAYTLTFLAKDTFGNEQTHSTSFTVDAERPIPPGINGGEVLSGILQARPVQNQSITAAVTLTGTREDNTSVWINDVMRVAMGSGDWSVTLSLSQGDNALEISVQDQAGNASDSVWVDIFVDSAAPVITSITPQDQRFLNPAPETVVIAFQEATSGINWDNSVYRLLDSSMTAVEGDWDSSGDQQLIFTPEESFAEDTYRLDLILEDNLGNRGTAVQSSFTVDLTAPDAPGIDPVTSPTNKSSQLISGTKEAFTAILLDGAEIIGQTSATTWQYPVSLSEGENTFVFRARDRAGNLSADAPVTISYADNPPQALTTLTVNAEGDGTSAVLSWEGYDESLHGDIASYSVYVQPSDFETVSGLTAYILPITAGTFSATVSGLTRNTTYWFAVVPKDLGEHIPETIDTVQAATKDTIAPDEVTALPVECFADSLTFHWQASANSAGDLDGYHLYFDDAVEGEPIEIGTTQISKTGLTLATEHTLRITAVDEDGNESHGVSITGVTLLDNPANLQVTDTQSGYVTIAWNALGSEQLAHLAHYAVYVSEASLAPTLPTELTPWMTVSASKTTANVTGLKNNVTYSIAVTAVNTTGGERREVADVTATPVPDEQAPELSNIQADGVDLENGQTLTAPVKFTANASDATGVSRVEFRIDDALVRTDYSGNPAYYCYWNIVPVTDGSHTLALIAYDTLGNHPEVPPSYSLTVALSPPAAPVISQPANGVLTNQATVTVAGAAALSSEVLLFNNEVQVGEALAVDRQGKFSVALPLTEGANAIQAKARYRGEGGPTSALSDPAVTVTRDSSVPPAPTNLAAQRKADGQIKLTWRAPANISVKGYTLYRATTAFTTIDEAEPLNSGALITAASYLDLPATDGEYVYRVQTVNYANTVSELSDQVSALSDRTLPFAASIRYTSNGNFDEAAQRFAAGQIEVLLTVSETLQSTPFFSVLPENGTVMSIELTQTSNLEYSGSFTIKDSTPSGTAHANFSARDLAGNRGTEMTEGQGDTFLIDTDGPAVTRLELAPAPPLKNDDGVTVTVTLGLDERIKAGELPELTYEVSGSVGIVTAIENFSDITTSGAEGQIWQGSFTLPSTVASDGVEILEFAYQGVDDLSNVTDEIAVDNSFQVYQGELPALIAPEKLMAESQAGGKIALTWDEVDDAASYQIHRRKSDQAEMAPLDTTSDSEYLDQTPEDGAYRYAVASVRQANGQTMPSKLSDEVEVVADNTLPAAPQDLSVELVSQGIAVHWSDPDNTEAVSFRLYRASGTDITTVEGLTPVIDPIPADAMAAGIVDPSPSTAEPCYVMTAVDEVGNESQPSNSAYHNVGLLPVATLQIVQEDDDDPAVSWSHSSHLSLRGYDLYLGADDALEKLNQEYLTLQSYTDTGYTGDERRYTVVAVDANLQESLGRSLTLPSVEAELADGTTLQRGVMNDVEYTVANLSDNSVEDLTLEVQAASYEHVSSTFSLAAGETQTVPVVIGGYEELTDLTELTTTIAMEPNAGERVEIIRHENVEVGEGMLVLQILNDEFTRGATGNVRFTLENTGEEEIEIVTASGSSVSPDIRCYLLDDDGNVLSSTSFRQPSGTSGMLWTLSNGRTVARIPAGDIFESEPITLTVPESAPDTITVQLTIDHLYYHCSKDDQVTMDGLRGAYQVSLQETSYYGEILSISPEISMGDQEIQITGRAVERATGEPLANVPLSLTISVWGFDRTYTMVTGSDGTFVYPFTPLENEYGVYTVRAVHPDVLDKPVHGTFTILRLGVSPTRYTTTLSRNVAKTLTFKITTGEGTVVNNLRLSYEAEDQPDGTFPEGVTVTPGDPVETLGSASSVNLPVTISADENAPDTVTLYLKVRSGDEQNEHDWRTVTIQVEFRNTEPELSVSPTKIEAGLVHDTSDTKTLTIKNSGLAALEGVTVSVTLAENTTAAPEWVRLTSSADIGEIAAGKQRSIDLMLTPTSEVAEGQYEFRVHISSTSVDTVSVPVYVTVTTSDTGKVQFKVMDLYTGTNQAGAKIRLYYEKDPLLPIPSQTTDSEGETLFSDLPTGHYICRVTFGNYDEYTGSFWIKTGLITSQTVLLEYQLVTVEWEVNEITLEDRYEIVLTATYKTDVPAAVVAVSPLSVTLPEMEAGDVFQGEFTLTNQGLIQAENLSFTLPDSDAYFRYELLTDAPATLGAKATVALPYRVTCLQALTNQGESDDGGGGNECLYLACGWTAYEYICASKIPTTSKQSDHCFLRNRCGSGATGMTFASPPALDGGDHNINLDDTGTSSSGSSGSGSGPSPNPVPVGERECYPDSEKECDQCDPRASQQGQGTEQ